MDNAVYLAITHCELVEPGIVPDVREAVEQGDVIPRCGFSAAAIPSGALERTLDGAAALEVVRVGRIDNAGQYHVAIEHIDICERERGIFDREVVAPTRNKGLARCERVHSRIPADIVENQVTFVAIVPVITPFEIWLMLELVNVSDTVRPHKST